MNARNEPVNDGGAEHPDAPDTEGAYLAECASLITRRAALRAELRELLAGTFTAGEVFARVDLDGVEARLAELAADPRVLLLVVDQADRIRTLEAVAAAGVRT